MKNNVWIKLLKSIEYYMWIKEMVNGKFVLHHSKQRKGDADYTYYMIAWYFRKNNNPIRQTIKYLGRLNKDEIEFYRDRVVSLNNILMQNYKQKEIIRKA